jgi:hypothetical protein
MKNKGIQKAVKSNGLDIMNGRALHLMFASRHPIKKQTITKDAACKALPFTKNKL